MELNRAREILDQNFPRGVCRRIVPAIYRGHSLAEQLVDNNEVLQWAIGSDFIPYIKRIAVEFELYRSFADGASNVTVRIGLNHSANYHHVELVTPGLITTASQVRHQNALPRSAVYRNNYSISNQLRLPFESENIESQSCYYALLTYGSRGFIPSFVCLGMPESTSKGWITRMNLIGDISMSDTAPVVIEEELLVNLRSFERTVRGG